VARLDLASQGLTERDIQGYVGGKVAKHKHLAGGVQFVQSIPRLPSGKIMRSIISQWAKRDAGRHQMLKSAL